MTTDAFTAASVVLEPAIRLLSGRYDMTFNLCFSEALKDRSDAAHYVTTYWPHLALSRNPTAKRYADQAMGVLGLGAFVDKETAKVGLYFFDQKGKGALTNGGQAPAPMHDPILLAKDYKTHNALADAIEKEVSAMLGIEQGSGLVSPAA